MIGIDWGTTNLRAYRFAADGTVIDSRTAPKGILAVPAGGFEAVFHEIAGPWLAEEPDAPVLLSGMVGSRQGWAEAPYAACPAGAADLAAGLATLATASGRRVHIVPGVVSRSGPSGLDVMRGEETQIVGAWDPAAGSRQVFCLPGSHSKWAVVEDGRIAWFATYMTGEAFGALADHTILGRMMEGDAADPACFAEGLDRADTGGGILHHLFSARTRRLFDELPGTGARAYLSGLLIGHEIRDALALVGGDAQDRGAVTLIGEGRLSDAYELALARRGIATRRLDGAAARGLFALGQALRNQGA